MTAGNSPAERWLADRLMPARAPIVSCFTPLGLHLLREAPSSFHNEPDHGEDAQVETRGRGRSDGPAAVAERLPPCMGMIEPAGADTCFLELGGSTWENLAIHLCLMGVDFQVEEPAELLAEVRRLSERYSRAVDANASGIVPITAPATASAAK